MYNTPPTWSIYIASLVFSYMEECGGLTEYEKRSAAKSAALYSEVGVRFNCVAVAVGGGGGGSVCGCGFDRAVLDCAIGRVVTSQSQHRVVHRILSSLQVDASDGFYTAPVEPAARSRVNVPFQIRGGPATSTLFRTPSRGFRSSNTRRVLCFTWYPCVSDAD